jgi:WD40 repeat protein
MRRTRSLRFVALSSVTLLAAIGSAQTKEAHLQSQLGSGPPKYLHATDDGRLLLSQGSNACVWLVPAQKQLRCFDDARMSALSTDGRALIYSDGKTATVVDPRSGTRQFSTQLLGSDIRTVAVAAGRAFVGLQDGSVLVYAVSDGTVLFRFNTQFAVETLACPPSASMVATGASRGKRLCVWDGRNGINLKCFDGSVKAEGFSRDGEQLALFVTDGTTPQIRIYDTSSWLQIDSFEVTDENTFYFRSNTPPARQALAETLEMHSLNYDAGSRQLLLWGDRSGLLDLKTRRWVRGPSQPEGLVPTVATFVGPESLVAISATERVQVGAEASFIGVQVGRLYPTFVPLLRLEQKSRPAALGTELAGGRMCIARIKSLEVVELGGATSRREYPITDLLTPLTARTTDCSSGISATGGPGLGVTVRDFFSSGPLATLPSSGKAAVSTNLSPRGDLAATVFSDGAIIVWNVRSGAIIANYEGDATTRSDVAFSPNGKYFAFAAANQVTVHDIEGGSAPIVVTLHDALPRRSRIAITFSPAALIVLEARTVTTWDLKDGRVLWQRDTQTLTPPLVPIGLMVKAQQKGNEVALGTYSRIYILSQNDGSQIRSFGSPGHPIGPIAYNDHENLIVSTNTDGTTRFWDPTTGTETVKYISLKDGWAVVDREGRYDASDPDGVDGLHWVVDDEIIDLRQLKQRFYVPGLLSKILGGEKLSPVADLHAVKLYPLVEATAPLANSTKLVVKLTNRGGGIGRLRVLVNGKEVARDTRSGDFDPNAPAATVVTDLSRASLLPGEPNVIEVAAANADGYLSSRLLVLEWKPPGKRQEAQPELYAIVSGISEYADDKLKLRFASKDAEDLMSALQLGAKRLFGVDKVHTTLLASATAAGATPPTKENLRKAFESALKAKPGDILFVYFAGHAASIGGEQDKYCYLTREGRGSDLSDPALRERSCVSSDELGDWMTRVPALKQVMILDTCAAGAVVGKFIEPRNLSADQIRAMELLKDRTGTHILMGSAADAVSYEANKYGQGLLTYSLLEGMRGAALKEGRYVDVSTLFNYATDRVPVLAQGIGGVQRPLISAPKGSSFPVGLLSDEDKRKIPLAQGKPQLLRPVLQNETELFDNLKLTPAVRDALRELREPSARGDARRQTAIVYLDSIDDDFPGAILPRGLYKVSGAAVRVTIRLVRDGGAVGTVEASGNTSDIDGLAHLIAEKLAGAVQARN